jgi:hypothetical protein
MKMNFVAWAKRQEMKAAKRVHLQGIGDVPAECAEDVKPGMKRLFNYGYAYTVLDVAKVSECYYRFVMRDDKTGKTYAARYKVGQLVPVI